MKTRPHLTHKKNIAKVEDHVITNTINLVKDDINENILTPDVVSNIRIFSVNIFVIFITFCILYLFYQICLDNYNEKMMKQLQDPDIYPYNFSTN